MLKTDVFKAKIANATEDMLVPLSLGHLSGCFYSSTSRPGGFWDLSQPGREASLLKLALATPMDALGLGGDRRGSCVV